MLIYCIPDRRTRDSALEKLRTYLKHRKQLDSLELLKLWKGLFFCMWMSDRPRVQQQLARDLAGLVDVVPGELVVPFLEAFWRTMAREWLGIDVLRYAHNSQSLCYYYIILI